MGFPCGSAGKESAFNVGDLGLIPGLGRSTGEGKGCPLQYSGLENSMDCIVHRVTKSPTRLSDFHFHMCYEQYVKGKKVTSKLKEKGIILTFVLSWGFTISNVFLSYLRICISFWYHFPSASLASYVYKLISLTIF